MVYEVGVDWTLPTPGRRVVPAGGSVAVESATERLTEYDTALGDLAACGVRLARSGEQWLLTVDGTTTPYPASGIGVPGELRARLLGARAGAALKVARRITRERTVYAVLDADGARIGEIADVHESVAHAGAAATVVERRFLEVAGWVGPFAAAVDRRLTRAGAVAAPPELPVEARTVGEVVRRALVTQRAAIVQGDLALRAGEDAVHRTRIALRSLRSVLRVVPVTEPDATAVLDAELRWYSTQLGAVRDLEVLRELLRSAAERAGGAAGVAEAIVLLERVLDDEHAAAQDALATVLAGRRYLALLRTLRAWTEDPPLTKAAAHPAGRVRRHVEKAERAMERRLRRAEDDEGFHRARKAAKRVRYAAALVPGTGRAARRAKRLQQGLGDHQDHVVAAEFLARIGAAADGPAAFGCGVLYAGELRRARRTT